MPKSASAMPSPYIQSMGRREAPRSYKRNLFDDDEGSYQALSVVYQDKRKGKERVTEYLEGPETPHRVLVRNVSSFTITITCRSQQH